MRTLRACLAMVRINMATQITPFRRRTLLAAGAAAPWSGSPAARGAGRSAAAVPRVRLFPDGTFDLEYGGLALRGAYPAIDNTPVHALGLTVDRTGDGGTITYQLDGGTLALGLAVRGGALELSARLSGFAQAPHWIHPLHGARVEGADRIFKQGLGFGGPSGLFPIARAQPEHDANRVLDQSWGFDSFLTAAVVAPDGAALAIGALDHRDYLQRTSFFNRTHRRELVDKKPASDQVFVEAGFSTERIALPARTLELPPLHLLGGPDAYHCLRGLAEKMARFANLRLRHPPRVHYDSWYEFYEGHDAARLDDTLNGLATIKPPVPFQGVLIDAGYAPVGEWLAADERLYPGGFPATFARIKQAGHQPGIWVCPFMVSSLSRVYREHPEWLLRGLDGKPVQHGAGKPFFYLFAAHEERYYLDSSHPGAFAHLREVFRTYRRWGVKSYKVDFFEWGFKDSTSVRRHTSGKTSVQYYAEVARMIRAEIGDDAYFLACISPFAPLIGIADGMRVAYDVDTDTWRRGGNTVNMFHETQATQYMNGVLWENDPDVIYVRDGTGTTRMTDDEAVAVALWSGILGGAVTTSDRPHRLPPGRLALLRFVLPGKQRNLARFPLWHAPDQSCRVAVRDYPGHGATAVLIVNVSDEPAERTFALRTLVGRDSGFAFAWRPGAADRMGKRERLTVKLRAHQSALFWLSNRDTPPPRNLGLSGEPAAGL